METDKTKELISLVRDMRTAQRIYFKTSYQHKEEKQEWLEKSKLLEKQVDRMIADIYEPKLF